MKILRLSCLLAITAALTFLGQSVCAQDKPIEIVFSTYMPTSYPYLVKPLEDFIAYVEKETDGTVAFKFFHSGQLYKGKEEFAALERGEIDMCAPNDLYLTGIIPNTGISNLPFLWETPASMQKSLDAGLWDLGINQKFEEHNVKVLGTAAGGPYQIYSKGFKVSGPDDMKGQKWGVSGSTASKAMELLGGSPTTMSSGELYMALQRGTINGTTRPLITGLGRKLYEVVDNLSVTNMAYFTCVLAINKEKWDSLPKDVQEVMIEAGKKRDQQQLTMLEAFMADAVKQYQEKGVNVHVATPEELAAFQERMKPVHEWWLTKVADGQKYIDFVSQNH
ncbi:MAG: TRAP transporter substrate-binding protein DctP [Desulfocapsaceae bacterium]|jgi:tripartite ATP-independent transporter DctP family solute receptor|nr:TRAP transporter substrate-binding protein DctP [Desulfocapsaceae bacterium]